MGFKDQIKARRAKEREARRRKDVLVESVRSHLLPAFIQRGFILAAGRAQHGPVDRESKGTFPFEQMRRARPDGGVDLVEIQFSTYERAAFRINAGAIPKEGMMTFGGYRTAEECLALGIADLETHARPWLRPGLRALGLEPVGGWFSVWHCPGWLPNQTAYDKLAKRVAGLVPEIELALSQGKLGPHMRRVLLTQPIPATK